MDKKMFLEKKSQLIIFANDCLSKNDLTEDERDFLLDLLRILNEYSFENRLRIKGKLLHVIADTGYWRTSFAKEFGRFDDSIK